MAISTKQKTWTKKELEELLLELIAAERGISADTLRRELEEKGDAMPIESLQIFSVLAEFMKRTGLIVPPKVPPTAVRAVATFADFVAEEARQA